MPGTPLVNSAISSTEVAARGDAWGQNCTQGRQLGESEAMKPQRGHSRIAFFGHFDGSNFGNESSLRAILYNLRRFHPEAEVTCICSGPAATAATYQVGAIPFRKETFAGSWAPGHRLLRLLRKALIVFVDEPVQWISTFARVRRMEMLVVPGTGLLTDAYGLSGWGPYSLFRWSLLAKLCRCKLLLVSVGAGPLYGRRGRWLTKSILRLADFRSYREKSTRDYLAGIGFAAARDSVYPDLAYSLPEAILPSREMHGNFGSVVGLGVMEYAGKYSVSDPTDKGYSTYLGHFATFAKWLLGRGYHVRLLSGDLADNHARQELKDFLQDRTGACGDERLIDEPIHSVDDLLSHIAGADIVVATRFHNVLFALLCNKPVIAISFHHKCRSLMSSVGLERYCLDLNDFSADRLIEAFVDLQKNAADVVAQIGKRTMQFRTALDQQYRIIFGEKWPA